MPRAAAPPSSRKQARLEWDDLRYALALHRTGTFSGAGAHLKVDPTTVGRRIGVLEAQVGARLFDRTQTGCTATEAGGALIARAERMESEALALERELTGADERLSGNVRVATTEFIAARFLAPHLPRFAARYPNLTLFLASTQATVDLARREADVAIRLTRPREPDVVARRFCPVELALFASRSYVSERGRPRLTASDLRRHDAIGFATSRAFASENGWLEERLAGARFVMRADSVASVYSACVAGAGLALLPRLVADRDAALVHIAGAEGLEPRSLWQAVHPDVLKAPRIRAVLEFLREILSVEASTPADR
ncbi:MAG: LysR family transcriptional regulator [Polyangiaceae bacterium]|jgi:DNA-binding transcriptional LysR family regulator|nr:LysR family transcriptional regulator [Polyangiaceae bacterium]